MIHCWTHISRHHPISLTFSLRIGQGRRSTYLFTSWRWISVNFLVTVLSVGFVILSTPTGALKIAFFPSPAHFVVSLLFPLVLLGLDIPIKHWREKRFTNMQKFRKLSFGTRLGMHSPRGDYEPEGPLFSSGTAEANAIGVGGEWSHLSRSTRCLKKLNELFFRYTTMRGGKLELNCVCCDHVGGNYATYHVDANI
ncbi:hypothetical protein AGDE_00679 [Angomonas deanei]|nr:hypothetical protein AGDE_00679 [Angomonas deanei]|eukprot:EPY43243.1 hypothetical protein AGDE_00679 [Angomonas deanei]